MIPERRRGAKSPERVLLVGWDAADWQMIQPLMNRGLMPTTKSLLESGSWGNIATTRPILSPILWNSIATGKRAEQHGVFGFTEPAPDGNSVRPVASTSRKCKALWNIATQCGLRSNVVGWYASHPAEPIAGTMVSNQFEQFTVAEKNVSPVTPASVHPAEMAAELTPLRVLPGEIDASAILPFISHAGKLLQQKNHRVGKLQHLLAQTATVHAVATHLMANSEWDFTAIYYEGIDRFGHEFMEFHPPKMEQVAQEDFDAYHQCMVGIYRFHDMLLETLLTLAGDNTAVLLISDHGYFNDHLRPDPGEGKSGPLAWHRPFGVFAGSGPGIRAGERVYGASILDVAPTVLQLLGLPVGYDMPGRVLAEVLDEPPNIARIESWEEIEGDCGMHAESMRVDLEESRAVLQQLAALGYIDAPGEDVAASIENTVASNQFNRAQSLADSGDYRAALDVIGQLPEPMREDPMARLFQATCHLACKDTASARAILEDLASSGTNAPKLHMLFGAIEFAEGRPAAALEHLERVATTDARLPNLHNKLGEVYLKTQRYPQAIAAFQKALEIDGESSVAFAGLARAYLETGKPQEALDSALIAAELVHFFPRVHFVIGKALLALGDPTGAAEALELCVKQAPRMANAYKSLASAYRNLGQMDKAMAADLRAKGVLA